MRPPPANRCHRLDSLFQFDKHAIHVRRVDKSNQMSFGSDSWRFVDQLHAGRLQIHQFRTDIIDIHANVMQPFAVLGNKSRDPAVRRGWRNQLYTSGAPVTCTLKNGDLDLLIRNRVHLR